jgi:hypothetical protein
MGMLFSVLHHDVPCAARQRVGQLASLAMTSCSCCCMFVALQMGMLLSVLHHDVLHADMRGQHPQDALKALVVQHMHQVATLMLLQRGDLMVKFSLLNHQTGELLLWILNPAC